MYHLLTLGFIALVIERLIEFADWLYHCCFRRQSKELEEQFSDLFSDMRADLRHKIIEICYTEKSRRSQLTLALVQGMVSQTPPGHLSEIMQNCRNYALLPAQELQALIEICRSYDARVKGKSAIKTWVTSILTLVVSGLFCWSYNFKLLARIDMSQFKLPGLGEISIPANLDIAITAVLLAIATKYLHQTISTLVTVKTRVKGQRGILL